MKTCPRCNITKELSAYAKCSARKDGLNCYCRECNSIEDRSKRSQRRIAKRAYYLANKEKALAYRKQVYSKKTEEIKALSREWYFKNKERKETNSKNWNKLNRSKKNAMSRKWQINNRPLMNELSRRRYAKQKQALPKWADLNKIKDFYKNCPEGYSVDHIVPLTSDFVCGLHVECNLQYLTKSENSIKNNSVDHLLWKDGRSA